jgi:hypothetical protein
MKQVMNVKEIEACQRIGRDEASRSTTIALIEFDALCRTALVGAAAATPLPLTSDEERVRDLAQRMLPYWDGLSKQLLAFLRLLLRNDEAAWYKDVIASEMGYSGPGGDAVCPLREWLRELKTQKSTPTAVNVPMIEAACEAVLELTGYSIDGDTMRTALETSMGVHLVAGNVDERLEVYDRLGRLICNYSNKIMELDGANIDQAEIPLILGDLIRDGLQEATRQAAILKKLTEFAKQPLGASEAEFVGVVSQSELLNILMERK